MSERRQTERDCKEIIRKYIKEQKKNKISVRSLRQIYYNLKELDTDGVLEFPISLQTFYRYAEDMNLQEISPGSQQFDFITNRPAPLNTYLIRKDFNNFICYKLKNPAYGSLIVDYLNDYYRNYRKSFYCVLLGDMIICFFYTSSDNDDKENAGKNSSPESLSRNEVIKDVRRCLKKYTITETK